MAMLHRETSATNDALTRIITLEKSIGDDGLPFTCLCEWGRNRSHFLYGRGPEPSLDNFMNSVKLLLAKLPLEKKG